MIFSIPFNSISSNVLLFVNQGFNISTKDIINCYIHSLSGTINKPKIIFNGCCWVKWIWVILVKGCLQTSLHQNYPNPFNPTTTIEYDLGFIDGPTQRVNVTVYDILGRNIKTLINEQQNIGRYRVKWNGKDQNDVPVSSGIYFINLLTDTGRSETKKIMLMR